MIKRRWLIFSTIISLLTITAFAVSFTLGYFYFEKEVEPTDLERVFGEVFVVSPIYFDDGIVSNNPNEVVTLSTYTKSGIYYVNISDFDSDYHINKLRVDFQIHSNIDTYFRVRIIDTVTIVYTKADGQTVEINVPKTENIDYNIDFDDWFYDDLKDWYYYKDIVTLDDGIINFITEGIEYPLMPLEYRIQFTIVIEAVQAHRGPIENWHLDKRPWDMEDWT